MRSFLKQLPKFALIFSLVFFVFGLFTSNQIFAQELTPAQRNIYNNCLTDRAVGNLDRGINCLTYARSNGNLQAGIASSTEITNNFVPGWWDQIECSLSPFDCALRNFVITIVGIILKLVSLLTGLGGIFLNGVIYYTVVKVAENYANIGAINVAWGTVRDVANMGFIFILLYAAIKTILGIGGDDKKIIVNVVVIAVLINFSLFFTKIVIDISNVLALLFYEAIVGANSLNISSAGDVLTQTGLSNKFTHYLRLQTLYQASGTLSIDTLITVGIMGSIMLLVAAFVFFAVAIMFVIRYVVLIFVLILSPLAFLGFVLPEAGKYTSQWISALIGQAFFAPIYFLLTWVTLKIIGGVMESTAFGTNPGETRASLEVIKMVGDSTQVSADAFSMLINFIVIIAFLIISLVVAKEWANKAGYGINGLTKWATGVAGGATLGMAGRFGRGTIGFASQTLAESETLKNARSRMIARGGVLGTTAAASIRLTQAAAKKGGSASFDLRGTGLGGTLDAGKAQKGGFEAQRKEAAKKEEEYAKSQEPSDRAKGRAKIIRDNLRAEEEKIRREAEERVAREIPDPAAREKLKKNIDQAVALSQNQNISPEIRARAAGRAEDLKTKLASMDKDIQTRRGERISHLVSSTGIDSKVKAAEDEADQLLGVNKQEREAREKAVDTEQKEALENDPTIKRQVELTKHIAELTKQLESSSSNISDNLRDQMTHEKEYMNLELERIKKTSEMRQKEIKDEFKARKDSIKEIKSTGEIRKSAEADAIEKSILAKIGGYNHAAAAQIRKGMKKKSAKELIDEALKDTGEKEGEKDNKPDDQTPPTTTP